MKNKLEELIEEVIGNEHHKICEGKKCVCHQEIAQKAYLLGKQETVEGAMKEMERLGENWGEGSKKFVKVYEYLKQLLYNQTKK